MIKFEKVSRVIDSDLKLPERSTSLAAGYDFYNPEEVEIQPNQIKYVKTGIKATFPETNMLMLCNRSSNPKKKGLVLVNGVGIVDSDYYNNPDNEGEIAFAFMNITSEPVVLTLGEKLGQGIFIKFDMTDEDICGVRPGSARVGGFGSTGA